MPAFAAFCEYYTNSCGEQTAQASYLRRARCAIGLSCPRLQRPANIILRLWQARLSLDVIRALRIVTSAGGAAYFWYSAAAAG